MPKRIIAVFLCFYGLFFSQFSLAEDQNLHEFELENGLKLIVRENHRAPVAVFQIIYRVGSVDEIPGKTGLSHLLEHLMFKGTKHLAPGEFSRLIAAEGGKENAFTTPNYTGYYQRLPSDKIELSFRLEAERLQHLAFSEEDFLNELEVVKEERRSRVDDNPQALLFEHFKATAFMSSPYSQPIIGWMHELNTLTQEDALAWHKTWYRPDNATLIVVGDIKADKALALANQYFAKIPRGTSPLPRQTFQEIAPLGSKEVNVTAPTKQSFIILGWPTPVIASAEEAWEPYALAVLAQVFGGGNSALLSQSLVRGESIASGAMAEYSPISRYPDLFLCAAIPTPGKDPETLKQKIVEQVQLLREKPITEEQLNTAKAGFIASHIFSQDSLYLQAKLLASLVAASLPTSLMDDYSNNIQAVTAEQVQRVARKYLDPEFVTVGYLHPKDFNVSLLPKQNEEADHAS